MYYYSTLCKEDILTLATFWQTSTCKHSSILESSTNRTYRPSFCCFDLCLLNISEGCFSCFSFNHQGLSYDLEVNQYAFIWHLTNCTFVHVAGVLALVVVICHADQISDVIFGNEGALKGLMELLHILIFSHELVDIQNT